MVSFLDEKNVLIVGGAGFVGSNLAKIILKTNVNRVIIVDNFMSADESNLPKDSRVQLIYGSIADDFVLDQISDNLDYVWHLACYHGNQSSIANPIADHDNNNLTSLKLFDKLSKFSNLTKVVYSGAGCAVAEKTYDTAQATAEDAPVSLFHDSPYSISKLVGEMYGNFYYKTYGMPFVRARFQNVYGPNELLGAGRWRGTPASIWRNAIPTFVWNALNGNALPVENGGIASRDFIFVEDICKGLIACAEFGDPGQAYNVASGAETTILELAEAINRITGNTAGIDLKPARSWDTSGKRFGSTTKAKEKLGFEATITLDEGLTKTVEWTIANKENIARSIAKHDVALASYHAQNNN